MCWTGREGLDSRPLLDARSGYHLRPWDVSDWVILWAVVCPAVKSWRGSKMTQPVGCLAWEEDLSLIPSTHVRQSGLIVHTWNVSSQCWGDRCEHIPEGHRPFTLTKSVSFQLETPMSKTRWRASEKCPQGWPLTLTYMHTHVHCTQAYMNRQMNTQSYMYLIHTPSDSGNIFPLDVEAWMQ